MVKAGLARVFPYALQISHARGMRRGFRDKFFKRQNRNKVSLYGQAEARVLSGPFKELSYLDEIVWGPIEPKWLGTYEDELHAVIHEILVTSYSTILDIGSAEGYYSVGLAVKMPNTKVLSFDTDPWARAQQARLATLNKAQNIEIRSNCSWAQLDQAIGEGTLVICDIEGYEYALLDPVQASSLLRSDILVELHQSEDVSLEEGVNIFKRRFSHTHQITSYRYDLAAKRKRFEKLFPSLANSNLSEAVDEYRPTDQVWLWCKVINPPLHRFK